MAGLFGRMAAPVQRSAQSMETAFGLPMALGSVRSASGAAVSTASAMQVSTVFACVTIPAEDFARATPRLYRQLPERRLDDGRTTEGGRVEVKDHPMARLFRRPNGRQDWFQFAGQMERALRLKSNAYAVILRDRRGLPQQLIPIHPDKVVVLESSDGQVFYQVARSGLFEVAVLKALPIRIPAEDVLHLQDLGFNMLVGGSRIGYARDSIGLAMTQEEQASRWTGGGARPAGVLKSPKALSKEARTRLKEQWDQTHGGTRNSGGTAVLEDGIEWQQLGLSSVDMEFLASRNYQVEDICRFFRVPPHKVAKMDKSTNNNIAAQDTDYLNNTLDPIFTRWERRLVFHFDLDAEGLEVDFDLSGLFRADPASRYNRHRVGILTGFETVNEARIEEGRTPVSGGDTLMTPSNMAALGSNLTGTAPDGAGRPEDGQIKGLSLQQED